MKKILRILTILCVGLLGFSLIACGNDEENVGVSVPTSVEYIYDLECEYIKSEDFNPNDPNQKCVLETTQFSYQQEIYLQIKFTISAKAYADGIREVTFKLNLPDGFTSVPLSANTSITNDKELTYSYQADDKNKMCTMLVKVGFLLNEGNVKFDYKFDGGEYLTAQEMPLNNSDIRYEYVSELDGYAISVLNNPNIESFEIPSTHEGKAVKKVQDFSGLTHLKKVTIPDSVTSIGSSAFSGCTSLTSIVLPNSITSIGEYAFSGCNKLESITLPFIGGKLNNAEHAHFGYIFGASKYEDNENCVPSSLKNVVISGGESIGSSAFSGCTSLTSVAIGNSVTSIGDSAFRDCTSLTKVNYLGTIDDWVQISFDNYCANPLYYAKDLYINDVLVTEAEIKTATKINNYAFINCSSLTSIVVPNSVTSIGSSAFLDCTSLTSIVVPNSVTSIGLGAFPGCSSLKYNEYDNGLYLGNSKNKYLVLVKAKDTLIKSCIINDKCKIICHMAFVDCTSLASITIPNSITSVGDYTFRGCSSLTSITLPNGLKNIASDAFSGCTSLTKVNYLGTIDDWAQISFDNYCANPLYYAKDLYINDVLVTEAEIKTATKINNYAFYNCSSLTSIVVPNSVTSIGEDAFGNCKSLTSIVIPDGVTSIGKEAFFGCSSLVSMTIPFVGGSKTATSASSSTLFGYIFGTYFYTGATATKQYYFSRSSYTTYYVPKSLKSVTVTGGNILSGAFYNCTSLTSVAIGESVKSIGSSAFYDCTSLTSVAIGNSVTSIGSSAFRGCSSLTSVTIGNSVKSIDFDAFYNCTSLASIILPNSVTSIGSSAFSGCTSLTSVAMGNSVTSIGDYAFSGCSSLTSVAMGNSVTSIGKWAFFDCTSLTILKYNGTKAEWQEITKGQDWGYKVASGFSIQCTDGIIK